MGFPIGIHGAMLISSVFTNNDSEVVTPTLENLQIESVVVDEGDVVPHQGILIGFKANQQTN